MGFGIEQAKAWMEYANDSIQQEKEKLTALDQAIGDGDHGLNMARGFQAISDAIKQKEFTDLGSLFKEIAMTLLSKVGGASGPLYGSAFLKGSQFAKDQKTLDAAGIGQFLQYCYEGLAARGKAEPGDKTMVDVWAYAFEDLLKGKPDWRDWSASLKEKMEATKEMEAKKGRAAYLGARSKGHLDPGSFSSYLILAALADVMADE